MSGADPAEGDRGAGPRLDGTRFGPVEWFSEIDSTNRYAADAAEAAMAGGHGPDVDGLVVVADAQHAGRGRLGRTWLAPPGASLLVSVVVVLDLPRDHLPLVTPAAALAASDALQHLAGIDARLKWPNDLVVGDRKLAGLLAESVVAAPAPTAVVGMGLNVAWGSFPDELAGIATACNLLSDHAVDRVDLLVEWLRRYDARLPQLTTAAGRTALRDACAARSATLGRRVRVELPGRTVHGVASELLLNGMLTVSRDDGSTERVAAGDVVHLRPGD
jgi:BirA family biotin operon repressor/biotin-[acetyl-CoA-carboxylase] ligase